MVVPCMLKQPGAPKNAPDRPQHWKLCWSVREQTLSRGTTRAPDMGERDTAHQPATRDVTALTGVKEPAFEAIVHMLDDGVIVLSADGHLKYVNPAALRMYDLPSGRAAAE